MSNRAGFQRRRSRLRRAGADRLVEAAPPSRAELSALLDFSNAQQFDALAEAAILLFYTETSDAVVVDAENDNALLELHEAPFEFDNDKSLAVYESLVSRAQYECKPHPNQALVQQKIAADTSKPADDVVALVYKRDSASKSPVKKRNQTPFRLAIEQEDIVVLFRQFSHDPFARAVIVWQREPRINSTIGLIGVRIETLYE